jgi:2-polyprenyl-6-methoxyphenol hydroxylase-like FAD-dependent oxidoreductase
LLNVDVLIAGGGPAGCSAAAALAELGRRVLVVDAGGDRAKQLAGELLHPGGVRDLEQLGFAMLPDASGARPVHGFAVIDNSRDVSRTCLLPYAEACVGIALEHVAMTEPLWKGLEGRPRIERWRPARVIGITRNDSQGVEVAVRRDGSTEERIVARMLVAADGRASPVRSLLGIGEKRERLSTMLGVTVDAEHLPHRGYGHLFVGGAAPALAYEIDRGRARVMVDLPLRSNPEVLASSPQLLSSLPLRLRDQVLHRLGRERPLMAANETRLSQRVTEKSAVLIGDAAGCCHPLSASGLASCTRDALVLQAALRECGEDYLRAAQLYARRRRAAQRTRIALASALYRAFSEPSAEMIALRAGLFRYWERSPRGRAVSMALLSTEESRMSVMAREYARVVGHGLAAMAQGHTDEFPLGFRRSWPAAWRLARSALPHLRQSLQGALRDRAIAASPNSRAETK